MARMVRKQIYVTPEQERRLKRKAKTLKTTEANLVREGINAILTRPVIEKDSDAWTREWNFINTLLRKRPVKGKRRWKREEIYER